jgi:ATP-binding cassette subfamily G (WHITE) protein 2 (SNQ2)
MLDVIGAGATAVSDRDWHEVWVKSKEFQTLEDDIDRLHSEGRLHPPVSATLTSQFATPWIYQVRILLQRQNLAYWHDPTYLMSKLSLNIILYRFHFLQIQGHDSRHTEQNFVRLFVK